MPPLSKASAPAARPSRLITLDGDDTLRPYWQTSDGITCRLYLGDVLETLRRMRSRSVHCCVTSPPYFALRDYGTGTWEGGNSECGHKEKKARNDADNDFRPGRSEPEPISYKFSCGKCGAKRIDHQLGSEELHDCYGVVSGRGNCAEQGWQSGCFVCRLVLVFRELHRVLRDDGTLWLNLGDSYAAGSNRNGLSGGLGGGGRKPNNADLGRRSTGIPSGNLCGVPWRVALAMQSDGWILRSDIPWVSRSKMPESVTNRPGKALEYVFLFSKQEGYYYDGEAVKKEVAKSSLQRVSQNNGNPTFDGSRDTSKKMDPKGNGNTFKPDQLVHASGRNFRNGDLWFESIDTPHGLCGVDDELVGIDVTSEAYPGSHYAVFGSRLITPFILAGSSQYGCCAKCGAPWERKVKVKVKGKANHDGSERAIAMGHDPRGPTSRGSIIADVTETVGWKPTCYCNSPEVAPCTVFDPFSGSGTTQAVAIKNGRRGVGIELSQTYIDQNAIPRITTQLSQACANPRWTIQNGCLVPRDERFQ